MMCSPLPPQAPPPSAPQEPHRDGRIIQRPRVLASSGFCIAAALLCTSCGSDDLIGLVDTDCPLGTAAPLFDKIAFGADSNIYVMNADGTCPTPLVNNAPTSSAAWSPDGTKILYVQLRDGAREIYVMNADGTGATRLTRDASVPAWSPDGTKIAFSSDRDFNLPFDLDAEDEYAAIYVINADGTDPTRLTDAVAFDWRPVWSPDGTKIAFHGGDSDIYVMNADGTDPTPLTNGPAVNWYPAWSPDGARIAFQSTRYDPGGDVYVLWADVYVMNADGTGQLNLTENSTFSAGVPAWSPSR